MSHTYAILEVTPMAFAEVRRLLERADYGHAFHDDVIDMHGIALKSKGAVSEVNIEIGSMLSHRTKAGLVELCVNGERTQLDLDKAREIQAMLTGAIEAAISDQFVYAFLASKIGLSEDQAARALLDFREFRQGSRGTVFPT